MTFKYAHTTNTFSADDFDLQMAVRVLAMGTEAAPFIAAWTFTKASFACSRTHATGVLTALVLVHVAVTSASCA